MCVFNNIMAYTKKRRVVSKKRHFKKKANKFTKRKFTNKKRFYKKKSGLSMTPIKQGTSHWVSYGKGPYIKNNTKLSKLEQIVEPNYYLKNAAGILTPATVGIQAAVQLPGLFTPYDLADQLFPQVQADTSRVYRLLLDNVTQKTMVINQSNAPCFMEFYDCTARHDVTGTFASNTPLAAWTYQDTNATVVEATPFRSYTFTQYWKVTRITKVVLAAGETHQHIMHIKGPHLVDVAYVSFNSDANTEDAGGFKNLTSYTFMVLRGSPADTSSHTGTTTSATEIAYTTSKEYTFRGVAGTGNRVNNTNTLPTTGTLEVTVVGSGVATNVANA
nr:MAG: capsid protein [Cressdnaviricota sp.]